MLHFLSMRLRSGTARSFRPFIWAALIGVFASLAGPVVAAEPIGGFSREPVVARRALTPGERTRLEGWNRTHPDSSLDPSRVSSLDLHFLKHAAGGREFLARSLFWASPRFPTARAYEEAARALAAGPADGRRIRRFRRPDGATITVETNSGGVVVAAKDGRIKTFFNAAARCSGREPAVHCTVSLDRSARWVRGRIKSGRLIELEYGSDPLAGPQPLASLPSPSRQP